MASWRAIHTRSLTFVEYIPQNSANPCLIVNMGDHVRVYTKCTNTKWTRIRSLFVLRNDCKRTFSMFCAHFSISSQHFHLNPWKRNDHTSLPCLSINSLAKLHREDEREHSFVFICSIKIVMITRNCYHIIVICLLLLHATEMSSDTRLHTSKTASSNNRNTWI